MIFADTQETTYAAVILGFLVLLLTVLQTLWQDWRAKRNAAVIQSQVVIAAKEVKKTAEAAADTAEASNKQIREVHKAVNGGGIMGAMRVLGHKLDAMGIKVEANSKTLTEHIEEDASWHDKIDKQLDGAVKEIAAFKGILEGEPKGTT
jgi:DNA anti-recombination protein RmuC